MSLEKVAISISRIVNCPVETISPEMKLVDLGIDSLKAINILFELEEEFDIEIPNELIEQMVTVKDIIDTIDDMRQKS